ncbi:MAG: HU family DNA-binding protein [Prevotellaceae bacterium]|jgi:DNA-binding protein HU-beta|nr:HU family DNA-binding protein [Prevotellaceae bacterium]
MTNKELITELATRVQLSEAHVKTLLKYTAEVFQQNLTNEQIIGIQGFGTFEPRRKEECVQFNPFTKKRMLVPPKVLVYFRAANALKEKIKSNDKS